MISRAGAAWRFVSGVSRGLRMGAFFPPGGRKPGSPAPGGSTEQPHPASVQDARGIARFARTDHHIDLPGLARPLTLLHLSDVHLRGPQPWVDQLCAALAQEDADLVLLTGDLVTRGWSPAVVGRFLDALPSPPLGRFAVMGNWEHWAGARAPDWPALLADHGVRLLDDEILDLGPLRLAGSDDLLAGSPDAAGLRARLADHPEDGPPTVVMTHSPGMFPALRGPGADLVLSGHSHGGQVRVPGLGALWVPRGTGPYVAGWYQEAGSALFVHRGVGWSIAPLRLGCPPELARIHLRPG